MSTQTEAIEVNVNDPWRALTDELDRWHSLGTKATFWWRDDDAAVAGPKLERLLALTENTGILLAVIPAKLDPSLAPLIHRYSNVRVAQHGYAHINYAPRGVGAGAWELGLHRPVEVVISELQSGQCILRAAMQNRLLPIVVPPWNHLDRQLHEPMASLGFKAISAFGAQSQVSESHSLCYANAHCDPIRWKTGALFRGDQKTLAQIIDHLIARRSGKAERDEVTGFLTHHIDLDEDAWRFCEKLHAVLLAHPAVEWIIPQEVFKGIEWAR